MSRTELSPELESILKEAATKIETARYVTAFTGAGISVESGIPPFRGEGGIGTATIPLFWIWMFSCGIRSARGQSSRRCSRRS